MPISAAKAEPLRPDSTNAASNGPSSRSSRSDEVRDIDVRAEPAHRHQRLERQDKPNQQPEQQHQRYRLHAGLICGTQQIAAAKHSQARRQADCRCHDLAEIGQSAGTSAYAGQDYFVPTRRWAGQTDRGWHGGRTDQGDHTGHAFIGAAERSLAAVHPLGLKQQRRAGGVASPDRGEIDDKGAILCPPGRAQDAGPHSGNGRDIETTGKTQYTVVTAIQSFEARWHSEIVDRAFRFNGQNT